MNKIEKIPDEMYFDSDGLSNSFLIEFDRSPAHAFRQREQTKGMKTGTLIHEYILSPEVFNEKYVIAPRDILKDKRLSPYKEFAKNQTKEILFQDDLEELEKIKHTIMKHGFEGFILEDYLLNSEKEVSLFWDIWMNDKPVQCKGKADALFFNKDNAIIFDLKKVQNCTEFNKSVNSYKYYRQANFYTTGLSILYPHLKNIRFIFITVEESYPYGVMTYEIDAEFMYQGEKENYISVIKYLNWDGNKNQLYTNDTVILSKPAWLYA